MPQKKSPVRQTAIPKTLSPVRAAADATPAVVTAAVTTPVTTPVVSSAPVATVSKPAAPAVDAPVVAALPADLLSGLWDTAAERGVESCEALAKLGDRRAIESLLSVLANEDGYCHVVVRAAAAMALGKFDDAKVIAALTVAARDPMAEVSREAVLALGELKAVAATDLLKEIVANASGYYVGVSRHAAVRSLGKLKAKSAQSMLTALAASTTEEPALTAAAREALAQL